MRYNEDKRIKLPVPFLQDETILYVDSRIGTSHLYIEEHLEDLVSRFEDIGYTFLFLPNLIGELSPGVLHYMFPGQKDILSAEDMYQEIQDLAHLEGKTGFLYRQEGLTYFRVIPEAPFDAIGAEVDDFISYLNRAQVKEASSIRFRIAPRKDEDLFSLGIGGESEILDEIEAFPESCGSDIRFSITKREDSLDPRIQSIIEEWERLADKFGITIQDLEVILGYKVKLSRLYITTANRIYLADLEGRISEAICDEPPFSVREGGILREGFDPEVDRLRSVRDNGAAMVAELEQRERERTGIKKLKLGFNRVFGYYIDVPNSAGDVELPEEYIRKQTLVSSERYFTPELKELENTLLTARERIAEIEYQRFNELRLFVAGEVARVQAAADLVARLDVFCSLAEVAVRNRYVCPEVDLSQTLDIKEGRHPVVEQAQKDVLFVPNDTFLNGTTDRCAIVTGPNMAGKSTYMRQTALIVLMAQIGSFVPAKSALIGVVDRVFTRIGASDDLAAGQSTFMVEMSETAAILKQATAKSLLILDEIGRGTSTYDGMAIARAVLEYCADKRKLGAKTMFATHYHELTVLERDMEGVRNYNITAKKQGGTLLFLRKIVRGAADDSYGIEVAKLAGLPESVVTKAKGYLKSLETEKPAAAPAAQAAPAEDQVTLLAPRRRIR